MTTKKLEEGKCPKCGCTKNIVVDTYPRVYECLECDAVFLGIN